MLSSDRPTTIAERLCELQARMAAACARAGRSPSDARLVAVSKGQPVSAIRAAYDAGQQAFGENYAQELLEKATQLRELAIEWHFIGTLQRNKARRVLDVARVVHTVDRTELAQSLARLAKETSAEPPTLLVEVNVGGEASKGGIAPSEVGALVAVMRAEGLPPRGLMTIPPPGEPEQVRRHFARLRELAAEHLGPASLLSMGMSDDFEVALEEGATFVRVGTALFGPRQKL